MSAKRAMDKILNDVEEARAGMAEILERVEELLGEYPDMGREDKPQALTDLWGELDCVLEAADKLRPLRDELGV